MASQSILEDQLLVDGVAEVQGLPTSRIFPNKGNGTDSAGARTKKERYSCHLWADHDLHGSVDHQCLVLRDDASRASQGLVFQLHFTNPLTCGPTCASQKMEQIKTTKDK